MKYFTPKTVVSWINFWPPFIASGIKVDHVSEDFLNITVSLRKRTYNTNYMGVHWGGGIYSMCDPFYAFILMHHLGREYIIWDQNAEIKFLKPGKGRIQAIFSINQDTINSIKLTCESKKSHTAYFDTFLKNEQNESIAWVKKGVYVKKK